MGKLDEPLKTESSKTIQPPSLPTRLFNTKSCTYHHHAKQTQGGLVTFFLPQSIQMISAALIASFRTCSHACSKAAFELICQRHALSKWSQSRPHRPVVCHSFARKTRMLKLELKLHNFL
jgi:hypothetical protein